MTSAMLYAAFLLQGRGDFTGAQEYLDRIDRNELKDPASKHMAAQMLNQQGDTEGAIKLLAPTPGVEAEPDLMLAILYRKQNKLDRAEEMCRKLLKKPDVQSVALAMDIYLAMGRPDDAQKAAQLLKGLKLDPGIEELLLADFAARSGKPQEALAWSRLAVQKAPQNPSAWKALFINCLANDKGADAWSALDLGLKAVPQDPYLLALADAKPQIVAGLANRKLQILTLSLVRNPQDAAGTKEVIDLMRDQLPAERLSDQKMGRLLQVTSRYPSNLPIQLYAIAELWDRGRDTDMDEAVGMAIRTAQSFPQSPEAVRLAATASISAKRWKEAASFAKAWRERVPEDASRADLLGATANLKMERSAAAKELLAPYVSKEVLAQPDKNAELITLYAIALQQSGATSETEKLILPLIKTSEAIRNAWLFQTAQYLSQDDQLKWLTRVSEVSGENSVMGDLQLAVAKADLGQKSNDPELRATARKMRARIMEQKDLSVPVMAVLASQCEQDGDLEGAENLYRRILAIDPGLAVIKNNLAMVLINRGESLDEAAKLAQDAVKSSPTTPNYYDTLAQAQAKAGKIDEAIKNLRMASQVDPSHLNWLINLTVLLADANRKKEANEVLTQIDADTVRKAKLSAELKGRLTTVRKRVVESVAVPAAAGS
jgi:tetratricopeptide (TPR) repeat protein